MNIEQGASNTILHEGRETLASPYFLLEFFSVSTRLYNYVITTNSGNSFGPLLLEFEEVSGGTADPEAGTVILSPPGNWKLSVYEQASSTNVDPDLASRRVGQPQQVTVDGTACSPSGHSGIGGGGCLFGLDIYVNGSLEAQVANQDPCVANTVNITIF